MGRTIKVTSPVTYHWVLCSLKTGLWSHCHLLQPLTTHGGSECLPWALWHLVATVFTFSFSFYTLESEKSGAMPKMQASLCIPHVVQHIVGSGNRSVIGSINNRYQVSCISCQSCIFHSIFLAFTKIREN